MALASVLTEHCYTVFVRCVLKAARGSDGYRNRVPSAADAGPEITEELKIIHASFQVHIALPQNSFPELRQKDFHRMVSKNVK